MSYAIAKFVYGLNFKNGATPFSNHHAVIEALYEADALQSAYSGNGETPMYIGVDIYKFDECSDQSFAIGKVPFINEPTSEHIAQYIAKRDTLIEIVEDLKLDADDDDGDTPSVQQYDAFIDMLRGNDPYFFISWSSS